MTTNDGTPISATIEPWNAPIAVADGERERAIADEPGELVPAAGQLELGDDDAARRR